MKFQEELDSLYQKALELKARGRQPDADLLELQAAKILQDLKDRADHHPEDPATAAILLYLAEREWDISGDHENVLALIEQALALRKKNLGPAHPLTAEALARLAEFHFLSGRFGEAEPLYRSALSITAVPKAFAGLAQTLTAQGRAAEADPFFEQAIQRAGTDAQGKRSLYFLLVARADGLEKLHRNTEAAEHRQKAAALLPQNNPGESGFHV